MSADAPRVLVVSPDPAAAEALAALAPAGTSALAAAAVEDALDHVAGAPLPLVVCAAAALGPARAVLAQVAPDALVVAWGAPEALAEAAAAGGVAAALPADAAPAAQAAILAAALAARARLLAAEARARDVADELEAFVHTVNHDLRAPVQGILGMAELVRSHGGRPLDGPAGAWCQQIERDAERLAAMIAALARWARLGRGHVRRDPVDLGAAVDRAFADAIEAHAGRVLRLSRAPSLPEVTGDADLLERLLFALVDNAARHHGGPRPAVHVGWEDGGPDGGGVLTVEDDGPGVPARARAEVLEPFGRLHRDDALGLGMGLAVASRIARLHDGALTLADAAAGGLRVEVRLPGAILRRRG